MIKTIALKYVELEPKDLYIPDSYEGKGSYLAFDGISYFLIYVDSDNNVSSITLPVEVITKDYSEVAHSTIDNLRDDINEIKQIIKESPDSPTLIQNSSNIDDFLKTIAVMQDPKTLKDALK